MKKALIAILAVASVGVANANIMIDDFNTGSATSTINSGFQYFSQNGSMVGGDRVVYAEVGSNAFGLDLSVDTITGVLSVNSQSGVDGLAAVAYGLNLVSASSTSFDNLNLDLSGESAFNVTTLSRDGDVDIRFSVRTSPNTYIHVTKSLVGSAINTPEVVTFNFSEFTGANFADVDQILVRFDTANSGDIAIDSIEAVPEPATMVVLAAAALAAARRRKS